MDYINLIIPGDKNVQVHNKDALISVEKPGPKDSSAICSELQMLDANSCSSDGIGKMLL